MTNLVVASSLPSASAPSEGSEETWRALRADYLTFTFTQVELSEKYGVSLAAIKWRIKHELWPRRYKTKTVDRPQIIARMFRVLELQVISLEKEMDSMQSENRRSGEREVIVLGRLATNLEKLMELDGDSPGRRGKTRSKNMLDLRSKLIERIEHLKRQ